MEHASSFHHRDNAALTIEVRLFNSLQRHVQDGQSRRSLHLPADSTVADVIQLLGLPEAGVHLVLRNGRPVAWNGAAPSLVAEGDVIAFSGPALMSWTL